MFTRRNWVVVSRDVRNKWHNKNVSIKRGKSRSYSRHAKKVAVRGGTVESGMGREVE